MLNTRKEILGFDDRWILVLVIPLVSFLVNTLLFGHLLHKGEYFVFSKCFPVSIYFTTLYWLVFREIFYFLIKKYPNFQDIHKRQIILVIVIFVGTFLIDFVGMTALKFIISFDLEEELTPIPILKIITSILFTFLTIVVYESFYLAKSLSMSLTEKEKLKSENINSKLSSLQNQINPHFLFNSLNTLSALIQENPQRADNFVTKLAKVYRHILEYGENSLVTVESELKYLRAYIHLLKERFGDNLEFSEMIDKNITHKYILPFSLQITFENCVKHNAVTQDRPLHVSLYSEHNSAYLCIQNNISPINNGDESTLVGLQNIVNRYKYFTNLDVQIHNDGKIFRVCLPILDQNHFSQNMKIK